MKKKAIEKASLRKVCLMKKQTVLALFFAAFCPFAAQGQEAQKNLISFGINFSDEFPFSQIIIRPGLSLEYERLLNGYVSVGLEIGTNMTFLPYTEIQGRWYPFAEKFYAGLGLGIMNLWAFSPVKYRNFFIIAPEIGWKFGIVKDYIGKSRARKPYRYKWAIIMSLADRIFVGSSDINMFELCFKIGKIF